METVADGGGSSVVLTQCRDLIALQEVLLSSSLRQLDQERAVRPHFTVEDHEALLQQLEKERLDHAQTRAALESEREKCQFAVTEVDVLRRQLDREKATFERAFGLLKSQALADSSKVESIVAKCTALEALCMKKDEELAAKNEEIRQLQRKIHEMKAKHKRTVQELNVRIQQEMYLAKEQSSSELKAPMYGRTSKTKKFNKKP